MRILGHGPYRHLPPSAPPTARAADFIRLALEQAGDAYRFGTEVDIDDPDPSAFDCSELVQWAASKAGLTVPDGSGAQRAFAEPMTVQEALRTPGALLFRPGHVAISLGDGRTIEARGRQYGVGVFSAVGRFSHAGWLPGLSGR